MKHIIWIMLTAGLYNPQCVMQQDFLNKSASYALTGIAGNKQDVDRIYFLKTDATNMTKNMAVKYDHDLEQIFLLSDTTLIAYYHVEKKDNGIMINNYNPLRNKVSYNDLKAREYKLIIQKKTNGSFVLTFENQGSLNRLSKPVTLDLKLITD